MPEVAIVEGVRSLFYADEHPPPHFDAQIAEHRVVIDMESLIVTEEFLPAAKRRAVLAWASSRQHELYAMFRRATSRQKVGTIE